MTEMETRQKPPAVEAAGGIEEHFLAVAPMGFFPDQFVYALTRALRDAMQGGGVSFRDLRVWTDSDEGRAGAHCDDGDSVVLVDAQVGLCSVNARGTIHLTNVGCGRAAWIDTVYDAAQRVCNECNATAADLFAPEEG